MLNEALYEQDWTAQGPAPERPHLESNRWLNAVKGTRPVRTRPAPEKETFDLLGVKLVWTKDGSRPFPEPVINVIRKLIEFAELPQDWDSYGGQHLKAAAVAPVIELVVKAHQSANVPRLHPLSDGGVGLSWARGVDELEISVSGGGSVEGLLTLREEETELLGGSPVADGVELLQRFLSAR